MTQDSWVASQTRALTGWLNSKISQRVDNLATDLADGLVLIELINAIVAETNPSLGFLTPVYNNPKFALQKMENIDDSLQYCRLVLQVNTCNISAEDIVGGNLKLILGLLWTLFVFSTARSFSSESESKSFSQIKTILLNWLNERRKHHALEEISNFNLDWSLQQGKRPDLVFASMIDHYSPGVINYRDYTQCKPLANLSKIISVAKSHFGIEDLAIVDDFNVLAPDEKSVLLYVSQWYMYFVVEAQEIIEDCVSLEQDQNDCEKSPSFVSVILSTTKLKNQYDTKSLRLLNQLNTTLTKFRIINETWKSESIRELSVRWGVVRRETLGTEHIELSEESIEEMRSNLRDISNALEIYEVFKAKFQPSMSRDLPEVRNLYERINHDLQANGLNCIYEPLKSLQLQALEAKFHELCISEQNVRKIIMSIYEHFTQVETGINDNHDLGRDLKNIPSINSFEPDVRKFWESLLAANTLLQQMPPINVLPISEASGCKSSTKVHKTGDYEKFRDKILVSNNQRNLTYTDLKKLLKQAMSIDEFNGQELRDIVRLIPARTILRRPESESFSDDSNASSPIFEEASKSLEHKLSGNYNKLYDVNLFISRLESGFLI